MNTTKTYILYRRSTLRLYQITIALLLIGLTACDADTISEQGGLLPDETAMGQIGSAMRSGLSFSGRGEVILPLQEDGEEPVTKLADQLVYTLSKPVATDTKVTLSIGTELTPEFLAEVERENVRLTAYNRTMIQINPGGIVPLYGGALFPSGNIQMEAGNLNVPTGKTVSEAVKLSASNAGLSKDTLYFLPVVLQQAGPDGTMQTQLLQYTVRLYSKLKIMPLNWGMSFDPGPLDDEFMVVLYVNTEFYQPLLVDSWRYNKINMMTWETEKVSAIGNIVNLKPATVGYDAATGRALFSPGPDLRYVLEHRDRYLRPLQARGRKICICIQGGGKGLGFCNLSDTQIADFTAQVKKVVEEYGLGGVNLWDEGAKYGKEGMPAVNTTSYPKLIKALREAMPDKLLTLVDKDEPTEYFDDIAACGGIEVGKYIDYAWHGYFDEMEHLQIIEPWATDHPYSDIVRKPIAGLNPERYGSINIPRYGGNTPAEFTNDLPRRVILWREAGRKKNNMVVIGTDLTANEQGNYEGHPVKQFNDIGYIVDGILVVRPWNPGGIPRADKYRYEILKAEVQYKHLMKDW